MFPAALFTIAKAWKQPKRPSTDEWIKELWCVYIYIYIYICTHTYTMEYYSARKEMKSCHLLEHGWTLRVLC